jgi:hypothetical protein
MFQKWRQRALRHLHRVCRNRGNHSGYFYFYFFSYQSISKRGDSVRWDICTGYAGAVVITVGIFWRGNEDGECDNVGVGEGRRP